MASYSSELWLASGRWLRTTRCVVAEFDELGDEFALLDEFLKARTKQGLTQVQVAEKIGTTQSAVARMESGKGKHSPSLATLAKYAEAIGCRLEVKLVSRRSKARDLTGRPSGSASRPAGL